MNQIIFISYASGDLAVAERVLKALEESGLSCWIAPRNIAAGRVWPEAITEAIDECAALVVLISSRSNASKHIAREVHQADERDIPIIPLRIEPVEPSRLLRYALGSRQWLDAFGEPAKLQLEELCRAVKGALPAEEQEPEKASAPVVGQRPARRFRGLYWWIAAALVVAIAGLAALTRTRKPSANDRLSYVRIPAGSFQMGCSPGDSQCYDDEKPGHSVSITRPFRIGETEVTVAAYRRFCEQVGCAAPGSDAGDSYPMVNVTWEEADKYCRWAGGRLPTEAEWEYAARAGTQTARYGPLDEIAWYGRNAGKQPLNTGPWEENPANYKTRLRENENRPHRVRAKKANAFGLYDMLGNVWEWCSDWYDPLYYGRSPGRDPMGAEQGDVKLLRGGSCENFPQNVRVSKRHRGILDTDEKQGPDFGFRCVLPD